LCGDLISLQRLFEDDRVAVVLHDDWSVRGHVMVVWKEHVENVSDLSDDEWIRLSDVYRRTERTLLDVTQADRAIVMKLGIAVPHLHIHIYPVSAALSREEVFAIIEGRVTEPRDERFVDALRSRLDMALSTE
jgi:diadenosine tetraphosphate (Ap4A) HIT family hydrolase